MAKKQAPAKTRKPTPKLAARHPIDAEIREQLGLLRSAPLTPESAAWIAALEWTLLRLEATR